MKPHKFLFMSMFALFALSGCSFLPISSLGPSIQGSGNVIAEEREVSAFSRISLEGVGQVNIQQGDEESLTVTTDDNILKYVSTTVRGDTLVLDFDDAPRLDGLTPTDGIIFDIVVKELTRFDFSGAGAANIDGLQTESLDLYFQGAGEVEITNLDTEALVVRQTGAGGIIATGQVKGQDVSLTGAGSYYAADLESETALIEITGVGTATLWVTETLDVDVTNIGSVIYYGRPRIISNVGNLANLVSLGDK